VTQVLACAELYFTSLSKLLHERDDLQRQLAAAIALGAAEHRKHCGSISGCDGFSQQLVVLEQLQANLRQEYSLRIMLSGFVWVHTLSCLQFAKIAVHSHPVGGGKAVQRWSRHGLVRGDGCVGLQLLCCCCPVAEGHLS